MRRVKKCCCVFALAVFSAAPVFGQPAGRIPSGEGAFGQEVFGQEAVGPSGVQFPDNPSRSQTFGQGADTPSGRPFNPIPSAWKWLDNGEAAFSYHGQFTGEDDFTVRPGRKFRKTLRKTPEKYASFPITPEGAVNLTYSPDSTMLAFTRDHDLYVVRLSDGSEKRLTFDGGALILNGYASWVYYEEIFGRPSRYRAFWWSPDSRKIGFYRFDDSGVPMFPIYSAAGQDGFLRQTRYPKAGEPNPKVRIGIVEVASGAVVWADFNEEEDQYFGTPFWGADSREFFVSREPRLQNTLDLYAVSAADGSRQHIYHETYKTWIDWIDGMLFGEKGLYMARSFETGWAQIYYLSYDGREFRRLTDGPNWRIRLLRADERKGEVYFTAERDARTKQALYRADRQGRITALTDTSLNVSGVCFSPDGSHFIARLSNYVTPPQVWIFGTDRPLRKAVKVADSRGPAYDSSGFVLPQPLRIRSRDGLTLEGEITFPAGFDSTKRHPVHVDIYGGPDTPLVRDSYHFPTAESRWWSEAGIIRVVADCRAAGHLGREGLDPIYRQLSVVEVRDFLDWAAYLKSLPYVDGDRIGVEGFSFGGTMTALLVMDHPDAYPYGIAGGGVYDWALYDTHYTERFMDTPQRNPEGYVRTRAVDHAGNYPTKYPAFREKGAAASGTAVSGAERRAAAPVEPVMLKITHGTGDDNVHFQNTLQLVDALQRQGAKFELMIYPDGMHGYRGSQGKHFEAANREFWLRYLCGRVNQ